MGLMAWALENSQILISAQKGSVANIIANSNKRRVQFKSLLSMIVCFTQVLLQPPLISHRRYDQTSAKMGGILLTILRENVRNIPLVFFLPFWFEQKGRSFWTFDGLHCHWCHGVVLRWMDVHDNYVLHSHICPDTEARLRADHRFILSNLVN